MHNPQACDCGKTFRSPVALKLHREEAHGQAVVREADDDSRCMLCNGSCETPYETPSGLSLCAACVVA